MLRIPVFVCDFIIALVEILLTMLTFNAVNLFLLHMPDLKTVHYNSRVRRSDTVEFHFHVLSVQHYLLIKLPCSAKRTCLLVFIHFEDFVINAWSMCKMDDSYMVNTCTGIRAR